jgi:phage terminase large subunit GpA-like protein
MIEEHHKTDMIARGHWVPENPGAKIRGYKLNCLYYQFGLGPRWLDLVEMWRAAQNDPAKLQVFIQERLAESWEDPNRRNVTQNAIADRAEPYKLRTAPREVVDVTVGVDTQDNRLAVHIVGWGRGLRAWTLDYVELPGDPDEYDPAFSGRVAPVWLALVDLVNRPIQREDGALLRMAALAVDIGGHKTEAVKNFVRQRLVRRPMAVFGAVQNNASALGKPKLADINWRGQQDKRGVQIWQIGTVAVKDVLFGRIGKDAERKPEERMMHFSDELPPEFFAGIVSEIYNPAKNRYEKKRGARNEPLDTLVYAYAAAMHPELRLHRRSNAEWDAAEKRIASTINAANSTKENVPHETIKPAPQGNAVTPARRDQPGASPRRGGGFVKNW